MMLEAESGQKVWTNRDKMVSEKDPERKKPKKKERNVDEESENVKAWLNANDDDDLGGAAFMF